MSIRHVNLWDIAGILLCAIPLTILCYLAGILPLKYLAIVSGLLMSALLITVLDGTTSDSQQSLWAWAAFLGIVSVICLIWHEMLGLVIGVSYYYFLR